MRDEYLNETQYLNALSHVLNNGQRMENRTGIDTLSVFGYQMRFNLKHGFPAITTKKLAWKSVVSELLWFIEGSTDERRLAEIRYGMERSYITEQKTIWTENADNQGRALGHINYEYRKELGPVYGHQWRKFNANAFERGYDQLADVVNQLKNNPESRRIIMSAWNPIQLDKMALPPCHVMSQFVVRDGELSCQLYQRSADLGLGVPFNIASYALLMCILAQICDLKVADFVWTGGDVHIYTNHVDQVETQLGRLPYEAPTIEIPKITDLEDLKSLRVEDFVLKNYRHHEPIKAPMAV